MVDVTWSPGFRNRVRLLAGVEQEELDNDTLDILCDIAAEWFAEQIGSAFVLNDEDTYNNAVIYFDESDLHPITIRWVVEGLSGSNTFYIWYKKIGGTAYLYHGEQYHHSATYHYPPITTKVTALPSAFSITGD